MHTRETLVQRAEKAVAQYPQYKGHFDNYEVARVRKDIRLKGGLSFTRGELVICDPASRRILTESFDPKLNGRETLSVWSNRRSVNVSLFVDDLTWED